MLVNIQFLRFVAAMLVVVYHTSFQLPVDGDAVHGLFWLGQSIGFAGVDIFFVISGFIMAYTTSGEAGRADSLEFTRRRLARIYSGYWPFFFLALAVFYWARPQHYAGSNLLASFFLWPQPLNRVLLEITWTLSFELYFYLLFALIVWLVPDRWRMRLCLTLTIFLLTTSAFRHFVAGSFTGDNLYLMPFFEHFLISPYLLEFFAGALAAYWLARHPSGPDRAWLLLGSAMFLFGSPVNTQVFSGQIEQGFHVVPRVILFGGASVCILVGLVRLEARGRTAPAAFSILTGGASYAIYLIHIPILTIAMQAGLPGLLAGAPYGVVAATYGLLMLLILAASVWHYRKLERTLHRLFKRWLGVRRHGAATGRGSLN